MRVTDLNPRLAHNFRYPKNYGVVVARVYQDGPAEKAGIQNGDIIQAIGNQKIKGKEDYVNRLSTAAPRDHIPLTIFRKGQVLKATLVAQILPQGLGDRLAMDLLGLSASEISPKLSRRFGLSFSPGVVVLSVIKESPAGQVGIKAGDVIRQVNQLKIAGLKDFRKAILSLANHENVLLLVQRGRYIYYVTLDL